MTDTVSTSVQPLSWREWRAIAVLRLGSAFWVALPFLLVERWMGHASIGRWDTTLLILMGAAVAKVDSFVKRAF